MKNLIKNLTVFLLTICVLNAQANPVNLINSFNPEPPVMEELATAYKTLSYKLNCKWDQKDTDFHTTAMKEFKTKILNLSQQGMTSNDLLNFLAENIPDDKVKKDFLSVVHSEEINDMSQQDAIAFVIDNVDLTVEEGSAFSSFGTVMGGIALVGALAVALALDIIVLCDESCVDYYSPYGGYIGSDCAFYCN